MPLHTRRSLIKSLWNAKQTQRLSGMKMEKRIEPDAREREALRPIKSAMDSEITDDEKLGVESAIEKADRESEADFNESHGVSLASVLLVASEKRRLRSEVHALRVREGRVLLLTA